MAGFNLLTDPWIPILRSGRFERVGIQEALLAAPQIARLGPLSPLADVAVHRLLLAIVHRALGGPSDTHEVVGLWESGRLPEAGLSGYLDRWQDRFDLFHPNVPFYQVADLPDDHRAPWTRLLPELSSGNNPTWFDHTFDDTPPPASPPEAAVALLVHQSFAAGGLIKRLGVTSGKAAPLASAAVFRLEGANLFETLLLNLVPYRPDGDQAIWERNPYRKKDIEGGVARELLSGLTRMYTWMSRSVRLLPDSDGSVRFIAYGPGVEPEPGPELDPMCAYQNADGGIRPYQLPQERAFWRDFEALLPDQAGWRPPGILSHAVDLLEPLGRVRLLLPLVVTGQRTDQAKILNARREVYPISARAFESQVAARIRDALEVAARFGDVLERAGWTLASRLLSVGRERPAAKEVRQLRDSLPLLSLYWSALENAFPAFLETLTQSGPETALNDWKNTVQRTAQTAWAQSVAAVGGAARHLRAIAEAEARLASEVRRASA